MVCMSFDVRSPFTLTKCIKCQKRWQSMSHCSATLWIYYVWKHTLVQLWLFQLAVIFMFILFLLVSNWVVPLHLCWTHKQAQGKVVLPKMFQWAKEEVIAGTSAAVSWSYCLVEHVDLHWGQRVWIVTYACVHICASFCAKYKGYSISSKPKQELSEQVHAFIYSIQTSHLERCPSDIAFRAHSWQKNACAMPIEVVLFEFTNFVKSSSLEGSPSVVWKKSLAAKFS